MAEIADVGNVIDCLTARTDLLPSLTEEPLESPSMLQRFGYMFLNPGKNYLIPVAWLQALMRSSRSPLITESFASPGGWRSMEIVYRNAAPTDWLDRQALRDNPIPMAARNRRKLIVARLSRLIQKWSSEDQVTLLGVGSGPGWHIQTAIVESRIPADRVCAYLIDLADDSFSHGRELAASLGLQESVHFLRGDARRVRETLPNVNVHIAKLVGVVEYLTDDQFLELLRAIRDVMVPGANLVTHGLVDKYGTGKFLARVFNLRHQQRDAGKMTEILRRGGFRVEDCEYEPAGIHPIITAVRAE